MQIGFYTSSIIFNLCLIAQVLTVGITYFNDPAWWNIHVWLVHGGLSFILLTWSLIAPFSRRIRHLATKSTRAAGTPIFSIHLKSPLHLEVFHPLIGFTLLSVSSSLVHRTGHSLLPTIPETEIQVER